MELETPKQATAVAVLGATTYPYQSNSSGMLQMQPLSIKEMRMEIALRKVSDPTPSIPQEGTRLIVGPGVPEEIVDLYREYAIGSYIVEVIDYTDSRVGSFSMEEEQLCFVVGRPNGHIENQPFFLLHPDNVQKGEDVQTLNYFPELEAIRIYTAPIEHLVDDDWLYDDCPRF